VRLSDLSSHGGEWLRGDGPEGDIVISSRVRLARNLADHLYTTRASDAEKREIAEKVRETVMQSKFAERIFYVDLEKEDAVQGELLVERHLISRELARAEGPRGVAFGSREAISIMVNEEDHLRVQVLQSGSQLEDAWKGANAVDGLLDSGLTFAFSPRFGYLTACPTNVGTGMRASVMLHLPALAYSRHIQKVFQAVHKMSLAVRGLFGEGTEPMGDLYQISNQVTLGAAETAVVENVNRVVPQIIRYERQIREEMLRRERRALEDRVWRSLGVLRHARLITTQETLEHLSAVRLGVNLGVIEGIDLKFVNDLFILSQPAHLQKLEGRPLEAGERDEVRAAFLRKRLAMKDGGPAENPEASGA
jgi:protein arginine kinase